MVQKYASLLSADAANYEKTIKSLEAQDYNGIHFDVMDGHFVKNFAFGPDLIKSLRKITNLLFQAHLEIENPGEYIDRFIEAGCDMITLHPQTCNIKKELRYLRSRNITTSVAIDPDIEIDDVLDYLNLIDNIIIMSVYPGFGKQGFRENSIFKIQKLKEIIRASKHNITISIDGGVDKDKEKQLIEVGCDILIFGSTLFK
ncbi:MAG: ribulose-phosphate 3-epimerase [Actinobacteria bacterium]|nr:ribulose-phosphate 3-epimerase [Actinomycetota bacterium]